MSKYLRSRSIPVKALLWLAHATPVVPLPMYGSQTVSAFGAKLMAHSISATGFCVGCSFPSRRGSVFVLAAKLRLVQHSSISASENPVSASGFRQHSQPLVAGSMSAK